MAMVEGVWTEADISDAGGRARGWRRQSLGEGSLRGDHREDAGQAWGSILSRVCAHSFIHSTKGPSVAISVLTTGEGTGTG